MFQKPDYNVRLILQRSFRMTLLLRYSVTRKFLDVYLYFGHTQRCSACHAGRLFSMANKDALFMFRVFAAGFPRTGSSTTWRRRAAVRSGGRTTASRTSTKASSMASPWSTYTTRTSPSRIKP